MRVARVKIFVIRTLISLNEVVPIKAIKVGALSKLRTLLLIRLND